MVFYKLVYYIRTQILRLRDDKVLNSYCIELYCTCDIFVRETSLRSRENVVYMRISFSVSEASWLRFWTASPRVSWYNWSKLAMPPTLSPMFRYRCIWTNDVQSNKIKSINPIAPRSAISGHLRSPQIGH